MAKVHIGKLLRELYLGTGLKMERFTEAVDYADKTIYYHFKQEQLNTGILDQYEAGLRKLGFPVDIWELICMRRKGGSGTELLREPPPAPYGEPEQGESSVELLRRAADALEKERKRPVKYMPDPPEEGQ